MSPTLGCLGPIAHAGQRALTSLQKTMGYAQAPHEQQPAEDVEMAPEGGLPAEVEAKIMETNRA